MENNVPEIKLLLIKVGVKFGGMPETPMDFIKLSDSIMHATGEQCSSSTLRRIWGYDVFNGTTRRSTYDILAQYIGYPDFRQFCKAFATEAKASGFLGSNVLLPESLLPGERIQLCWKPDRRVILRALGDKRFEVELSEKSHLKVGDTFEAGVMAKGYPVFLTAFIRDETRHKPYVAASAEGLDEIKKL